MIVLLPEPDGPTIAMLRPAFSVKQISFSTVRSGSYPKVTWSNTRLPSVWAGITASGAFWISTGMSKYSKIRVNSAMERIQSTWMFSRLFTGMYIRPSSATSTVISPMVRLCPYLIISRPPTK